MSGIQIADAKAPFVRFEVRAEEDRAATIASGRFVAKDVVFALITPHGSKDRIERVAEEWLAQLDQQCTEGRMPRDWAKAYRHAYNEFLEGREVPPEGTAIINWPLVSPSQVRALQDLKVLTVEVLAGANEEVIRRLGMGGRDLVKKAQEFLKQANGPGKDAARLVALEQQVNDLTATVQQLTITNQALSAQVKAGGQAQPTPADDSITSDDLFGAPAPGRKL
jgi:hypothetical protein